MAKSSEMSGASSRNDTLQYLKKEYGLDDIHAKILYRAERLQEKGQVDQALTYFQAVLAAYPMCKEAEINVRMIQQQKHGSSGARPRTIPCDAEVSTYSEECMCCFSSSLKRLSDGRSKLEESSDLDDGACRPPLFFPCDQSDSMWGEIIEAVEDGSGLSTHDPTNWHDGGILAGVQIEITLNGNKQTFYSNGNSPVEKIIKARVKNRTKEVYSR
eukprot:TRINITY_DN91595_c0_g1_i1.p1 TRINITY_DN91595_c0_g1~~TRINITY_DN91595_c0_g1_i1.p1  ORF type:complete len:215 (-),score=40.62 TRINITY_DN91595_c0_g1_i1:108-752(-)